MCVPVLMCSGGVCGSPRSTRDVLSKLRAPGRVEVPVVSIRIIISVIIRN